MNGDSYKYIRYNASQETRWATPEEIKRSCARIDLNSEDYPAAGIPIISDGKEAYVDNSDTHTLIFGATGSKKTRLFCMPMINMMAKAGESFVVTDPKGELYAQTSGLVEKKGYKTIVLNFRDIGRGDMWNPLSLPYSIWHEGDPDEAGMLLADIAATLASEQVKNTKDSYWPEAAQELAVAGLYTLMEVGTEEEANMRSFCNLVSYKNVEVIKELCEMMREESVASINFGNTACLKAQVTASGIYGVLFGMLRVFYTNEKLMQMLSRTTFDIRRFGREKTAVYLIVPDEKTTYHFLITMFIKQVYEIMISEAQKEKNRQLPVRVNFVLDEFCNIPAIPDMASMISAARSRNMRYFLVVQSMHQLKGRYGEDADTIKGNCDNWVFLTSKELDLLNEISELCGDIVTADLSRRRLISVSELQRFSKEKGEALIMHGRQYPLISNLPDISDYKMFGIYEPSEPQSFDRYEMACFLLSNMMRKIEAHEMLAPFASEEHILKQAREIYNEELREVSRSPFDDEDGESPLERFIRMKSGRKTEQEENPKSEEELEAERKEREDAICRRKAIARKRIATLVSEEYAERFFAEKLYEDDDE